MRGPHKSTKCLSLLLALILLLTVVVTPLQSVGAETEPTTEGALVAEQKITETTPSTQSENEDQTTADSNYHSDSEEAATTDSEEGSQPTTVTTTAPTKEDAEKIQAEREAEADRKLKEDIKNAYHTVAKDFAFDKKHGEITGLNEKMDWSKTKNIYLEIPAEIEGVKVTAIRDFAFYQESKVVALELPQTLELVGGYAFAFTRIRDLDLSTNENLTTLEDLAFYDTSLKSLVLPKDLKEDKTLSFAYASFGANKLTDEAQKKLAEQTDKLKERATESERKHPYLHFHKQWDKSFDLVDQQVRKDYEKAMQDFFEGKEKFREERTKQEEQKATSKQTTPAQSGTDTTHKKAEVEKTSEPQTSANEKTAEQSSEESGQQDRVANANSANTNAYVARVRSRRSLDLASRFTGAATYANDAYQLVAPTGSVAGNKMTIKSVQLVSANDTQAKFVVTVQNGFRYNRDQTYHQIKVTGQFKSLSIDEANRIVPGTFRTPGAQSPNTDSVYHVTVNYNSGVQAVVVNWNMQTTRQQGTSPSGIYQASASTTIRLEKTSTTPVQPGQQQGALRVNLNNQSDFNLASAQVNVRNASGTVNKTQAGAIAVNFTGLPVDTYTVTVSGVNSPYFLTPQTSSVSVVANQTVNTSFTITKTPEPVTPPTTQKGRVFLIIGKNGTANFPSGWTVQLTQNGVGVGNPQAVPVRGGTVTFNDVPYGSGYNFRFFKTGNWVQEESIADFSVNAPEQSQTTSFRLEAPSYGDMIFTVTALTNGTYAPISGAEFKIRSKSTGAFVKGKSGGDLVLRTETNGKAQATVNALPAGMYYIVPTLVPAGYQRPNNYLMRVYANKESYAFNIHFNKGVTDRIQMNFTATNTNSEPVAGVRFKIKDVLGTYVKDTDGRDIELVTNEQGKTVASDGTLQTIRKLGQGDYYIEVIPPAGYRAPEQQQVMKVASTTEVITYNVQLAQDQSSERSWQVELVDESGAPLAGKTLVFTKSNGQPVTSGGAPFRPDTEMDGKVYVDRIASGRYTVTFDGDDRYQMVEQVVDIPNDTTTTYTKLVAKLKEGKSALNIYMHDTKNKPAGGAHYIVRNKAGVQVAAGTTNLVTGRAAEEDLPYGEYTVEFASGNGLKLSEGDVSPKQVTLSSANKTAQVEFAVERQTLTISNAGSLKIEGTVYTSNGTDKTNWSVEIQKNASAPSTAKRGIKAEIKIPVSEMTMPSQPVLTIKKGDKITANVPVDGSWQRENGYYVFRDERLYNSDMDTEETIYIYSFDAVGVTGTQQYTASARAEIISSDPSELIKPVEGTKVLKASDKVEAGRLGGVGTATTDTQTGEVNWHFDGDVDVKLPGKVTFTMTNPEDGGTKPFDPGLLPVVKITDEYGQVRTDIPYKLELSPDNKTFILTMDAPTADKFKFQVDGRTKIDTARTTSVYTMDTKTTFVPAGSKDVLLEAEQKIATPSVLLPSNEKVEQYSDCEDGRHRVNLSGNFSDDGKYIEWEARLTNASKKDGGGVALNLSEYMWPFSMGISVGDGLGPAEITQVSSSGKAMPYLLNEDLQTVYDDGSSAGKNFDLRADYSEYHYMKTENTSGGALMNKPHYSYLTGYNSNTSGITIIKRYEKTSLDGNKYWWDPASGGLNWFKAGSLTGPNFQRLARGEYMIVKFRTPITDFSRARRLGPDGQPLGYEIRTNSRAYDFYAKDETFRSRPTCEMQTNLVMREKKNLGNIKEVVLEKDGIGEVRATGEFIEDGTKILWTIKTTPQVDSVWNMKATRSFQINYALVDSNNNFRGDTGLGEIQDRTMIPVSVGDYRGRETATDPRSGQIIIDRINSSENLTYTFVTPVIKDMDDYRLRVEAFYGEGNSLGSDPDLPTNPLPKEGQNIDYVILEGRTISVMVQKRWENVYSGNAKPAVTFRLMRTDFAGKTEEVSQVTLKTPNNSEYISYRFESMQGPEGEMNLPRFDENGDRYTYFVLEDTVAGYDSEITGMNRSNTLWRASNTKLNVVEEAQDKVKYVSNRGDGTYPDPYLQDGPDIRNADTKHLNNRGENYKVEYDDAIIGKSGQQTNVPGLFNMKLTMEGKSKSSSGAADIIFVVDNSYSMKNVWGAERPATHEVDTKMYQVRKTLERLQNELLIIPGTRIGIVNFATMVERGLTPTYKLRWEGKNTPQTVVLNNKDVVPLTSSAAEFAQGIPRFARQSQGGNVSAYMNDGQHNLGTSNWDGETNIVAGLQRGVAELYPESERGQWQKRQKILVLISDGSAVGSVKLKNYPLDPSKPLFENLSPTTPMHKSSNPLSNYIIVNNKYNLYGPLVYYTDNGVRVDNHETSTTAVADYYKALHPDMEVFSFAVDPLNSGWTDPDFGQNNLGLTRGEAAAEIMERQLRNITTDKVNNYIRADRPEEFKEKASLLNSAIKTKSIVDGVVEDPMGRQVILDDRFTKGVFEVASTAQLEDGDFYLSDNQGNYLAKDGSIRNTNDESNNNFTLSMYMYDRTNSGFTVRRPNLLSPTPVQVRLDTNGQPLTVPSYDRSTHSVKLNNWVPNYITEQGPNKAYGVYNFVIAENLRTQNPERMNSYTVGNDFRILDSLDKVLAAKKAGKHLILIRNGDTGLFEKPFETQLGLNQMPKVAASASEKNLLDGVKVERVGDKLRITGLNLGKDEEVTLRYRIHINTETKDFYPDFYYQANKTTTLNPKPAQGDHYRYFPIPSVKAPYIPIEMEKQWVDRQGNRLSAEAIARALAKADTDHIDLVIYRYKAKRNSAGVPINAEGSPLMPGERAVADLTTKEAIREVRLNSENNWSQINKDLTAYDSTGALYIYRVEEKEGVLGFKSESYSIEPRIAYSEAEGYKLLPKSDAGEFKPLKAGERIKVTVERGSNQVISTANTTVTSGSHTYLERPQNGLLYPAYIGDTSVIVELANKDWRTGDRLVVFISRLDGTTEKQEFILRQIDGNQFRFAVVNRQDETPKGRFKLIKADKDKISTLLKGAIFRLTDNAGEQPMKVKETLKDGTIVFDGLEVGEYTLREMRAPVGYQLPLNHQYRVVVTDEGADELTVKLFLNGALVEPVEKKGTASTDGTYALDGYRILNSKLDIPYTGGLPFINWTLLSLAIAFMAVAIYVYSRNRKLAVRSRAATTASGQSQSDNQSHK